ncbi:MULTISPECIES: hypothetical protein [unclassified Rhizobium]|jgi:hypothetical protein|uniref:hypothetical protein n=1 Tax=unclassified Rhizobium TaxID=2613769 RepID=UPI000645F63F|nr:MULTISPECIES: hypothetical protein [unclassified Rhizobium]MBN8949125.1 hypothetical protein [Rhizobium tropici]OJY74725.1 MAG: hypothetical protein BGP09_33365 [Rhizobium sp. 60-20]RKD66765.1 hypothetical protein BJ928_106293 [Rhizobium sp. WW_1]
MLFDIPADPTLERIQAQTDIDRQVRLARMMFVTVIPGQDAVYALKVSEALSIAADPQLGVNVPEVDTPNITAEAAEDGVSRFEKAAEILTRDQHWKVGSQMIEAQRRSANAALSAANTAPEIRAAAEIDWRAVRAFAQT